MDSKDKSSGSEKDELQNRPSHKITLEAWHTFDFGLSTSFTLAHIADRVTYSRNTPLVQEDLGDYTVMNLKIEQSFWDGLFRVYLGADNLFDVDYEESYAYPREGRFIYGGCTISF
jgi:outer membrane cobalamin receptor